MTDERALRGRVEAAFGRRTTAWVRPDTGLSAAARYSVTLADGTAIFVKAATDDETERWLRTEHLALLNVPERFSPRIVTWLDQPGEHPILVVEDLRRAYWPAGHRGVDWRDGDIDRVLDAVADLSHVPAPRMFRPTRRADAGWPAVTQPGARQDAFLTLGLCSRSWLADAGPSLIDAEADLDESGDRMVHGDLRSDNICIGSDRVVFVDWSHASRGNPDHDLANLLPTLHLEGGPLPFDVMPTGSSWAASQAAALARRVVEQTDMPGWLADVIRRLSAITLSWAASCLDHPQPDGVDWRMI